MLETSLRKFFCNFYKVAQKVVKFQSCQKKYCLPNGLKSSPNCYKLLNLAALFVYIQNWDRDVAAIKL